MESKRLMAALWVATILAACWTLLQVTGALAKLQ
jgi:hypothetical protein